MKALLVVAGLAVATALVSGALLVGLGPGAGAPSPPTGADPPGRGAPAAGAPAAEDRAAIVELERKVRALEARLEEFGARADSIPSLPGAARPSSGAGDAVDREQETDPDSRTAHSGGSQEWTDRGNEEVQAVVDKGVPRKEPRRDAEIRRRIDRAAEAMGLTAQEKARVEEIARAHVERADAIALRAKEALKHSTFGFTEADRALVDQLTQDRARLDKETEQSLVLLVGPERWKAGLKTDKDQEAKEKAVKRLEKPW